MTRRVLVTGGAQRLGAVITRQFAQAGWEVWCHFHRSAQPAQALCDELGRAGLHARPVQADLADEAQRHEMMARIAREAGPLHCLVNNASLFEPDRGDALDVAAMRQQLEVNLLAPLALSSLMARQACADERSGQRCILHILDQKVYNLNPDYFSYTVSKLALERTVALQAQALAPAIRVCGVAPGLMYLSGPQTPRNFELAGRVNLLRRPTDPERVAAACRLLAENDGITGTTLTVDNGQHLVPLPRDVMFVVDDLLQGNAHGD